MGGGDSGSEYEVNVNLTAMLDVLTNLLFFLMFGFAAQQSSIELEGLTSRIECSALESGLDDDLKRQLLRESAERTLVVRNDVRASPTGFPFKMVSLPGTVADDQVYADRPRLCDLGYLRTPFRRDDGTVGHRCPAEPVDGYVRKGGMVEDTVGSRCLCNGLVATVGLGQRRADGYLEPPLVTLGQDVAFLPHLIRQSDHYTAADVIRYLLTAPRTPTGP